MQLSLPHPTPAPTTTVRAIATALADAATAATTSANTARAIDFKRRSSTHGTPANAAAFAFTELARGYSALQLGLDQARSALALLDPAAPLTRSIGVRLDDYADAVADPAAKLQRLAQTYAGSPNRTHMSAVRDAHAASLTELATSATQRASDILALLSA